MVVGHCGIVGIEPRLKSSMHLCLLYIAYKRAGALTYVYKTYTYTYSSLFDDTLVHNWIGFGLQRLSGF